MAALDAAIQPTRAQRGEETLLFAALDALDKPGHDTVLEWIKGPHHTDLTI
jgi:hypothetical protein